MIKISQHQEYTRLFQEFLIEGEITDCVQTEHIPGELSFIVKIKGQYYLSLNTDLTKQNCLSRMKEMSLLRYLSNFQGFVAFKGVQIKALQNDTPMLCVLYEYLPDSIDRVFELLFSKNVSSSQIKMYFWKSLWSIIKCLDMLQKAHIFHGNINYFHLQLRMTDIKVPKLFFNPNQPTSVQLYRKIKIEREQLFLSPEQVEVLNGQKQSIDYMKSDIFNLGTLFMELLLVQNSLSGISRIYTRKQVQNKLFIVSKIHGFEVGSVLKKMIGLTPKDRPQTYELELQIRNIIDILQEEMSQCQIRHTPLTQVFTKESQQGKDSVGILSPLARINKKKLFPRQDLKQQEKKGDVIYTHVNRVQRKSQVPQITYDGCLTTYCVFKLF